MFGRRLKGIGLLLLLGMILCLVGCGASQGQDDTKQSVDKDQINIGMSFDSFVIERWLTDRNVFVSTAEASGASVNVQSANGDVATQIKQIEYLIDQKMDVIVIVPVDCDSLSEVIQKAKDKGIKIISYDRLAQNSDVDMYISYNNEMIGQLMGEAIVKELGPSGGNVYMIGGSGTDTNADQVVDGFKSALSGSKVKVTYEARCENWNAILGYDYVNEGLKQQPEVDAVMCGNDDIASQVFMALSEKRLAGEVILTGQDADLVACQRIVQGTQLMTVFKSFEVEARTAAEYAIKLAKDEDVNGEITTINDGTHDVPYLELDPVAVDKDNIDSVIIDSGVRTHDEVYNE